MRTHKADLGQIDQAIWNTSRGRFVEQTDNGFVATRLTDHVEPILALISPIYWLWDDVRALLFLQVLLVALGVLPLYALAVRQFEKLLAPRDARHIWDIEPLHSLTRPLALSAGRRLSAGAPTPIRGPDRVSRRAAGRAASSSGPSGPWTRAAGGSSSSPRCSPLLVKEEIALLAAGLGVWAIWRAWWDGRHRQARRRN